MGDCVELQLGQGQDFMPIGVTLNVTVEQKLDALDTCLCNTICLGVVRQYGDVAKSEEGGHEGSQVIAESGAVVGYHH